MLSLNRICVYMLFLIFLVTAFSCRDKDLDDLRRELDDQVRRLEALEAHMSELNSNISALQGLTEALKQGKQILSVTPTWDGYTLLLSDQTIIRIYHGMNGADGADGGIVMPSIAVRDSSDGHSYWTVDGRLLLNSQGKPVRADGEQGAAGSLGTPGITPQIRVNPATNCWETSIDGGVTWASTGIKATGDKGSTGAAGAPGDAVFAPDGVDIQDAYVEFTLKDGTRFRVPRYSGITLLFPDGLSRQMLRGTQKQIPFRISGTGSNLTVNAAGSGGWNAEVLMASGRRDSGVIVVTAPQTAGKGTAVVILDNGAGSCHTYNLSLTSIAPGKLIFVPGGSLAIIGSHGVGWSVSDFWLSRTEVTCLEYCDFLNSLDPIPTKDDIRAMSADTVWFEANLDAGELLCYTGGRWEPKEMPIYYSSGIRTESVANYPMANISWFGARAYCRWADGSLPTEAQWEYAARGGEGNPNAATERYSGSNSADEVGWFDSYVNEFDGSLKWDAIRPGPHPVAQKKANYLGFYDMSGNVDEWCKDCAFERGPPELVAYPQNGLVGQQDPQGALDGPLRIFRGGGIGSGMVTLAIRSGIRPNYYNNFFRKGFRLVINIY